MINSCPVCGKTSPAPFYNVARAPVACSFVFEDANAARAVTRGDIELCQCNGCGLIYNRTFDPGSINYGTGYEESQGYSGTFSGFEDALCRRLTERFDLRGKTVLEVGCGKGTFLTHLCDLSGANGLGFDPAFDPGRLKEHPRVRFRRENFSNQHNDVAADLVCCKMTLEHVDNTSELLGAIRNSANDAVFIQVPAAERIFSETAFWDIYYEHCIYFTRHSLANALVHAGLDVDNIELAYDGQYLLAYARAGSASSSGASMWTSVGAQFQARALRVIEHWRALVSDATGRGPVVLWGGGSKAVAFVETAGIAGAIHCVVDINPYKQNKFLPGSGLPVMGPQYLQHDPPATVLIMNPVYQTEIAATLSELELSPNLVPVT